MGKKKKKEAVPVTPADPGPYSLNDIKRQGAEFRAAHKGLWKMEIAAAVLHALCIFIIIGSILVCAQPGDHTSFIQVSVVILVILREGIINPLDVARIRRYSALSKGTEAPGVFTRMFFRDVKVLIARDIRITGWSILFIIPGINAAYRYRLAKYMLALDLEGRVYEDCFDSSSAAMYGHIKDAILFDLSFAGHAFLSLITFGLYGIFIGAPIKRAAEIKFDEWLCASAKLNSRKPEGLFADIKDLLKNRKKTINADAKDGLGGTT